MHILSRRQFHPTARSGTRDPVCARVSLAAALGASGAQIYWGQLTKSSSARSSQRHDSHEPRTNTWTRPSAHRAQYCTANSKWETTVLPNLFARHTPQLSYHMSLSDVRVSVLSAVHRFESQQVGRTKVVQTRVLTAVCMTHLDLHGPAGLSRSISVSLSLALYCK